MITIASLHTYSPVRRTPLVPRVQPVVRLQPELPQRLPLPRDLAPNKEASHTASDTSVYKPFYAQA